MRNCPYCGNKIPDGEMDFCPQCGQRLRQEPNIENMSENDIWKTTLEILTKDRYLASRLECNSNILPKHTMGGHVFYTNLCVMSGWKVQQNDVFGFVRILDNRDDCIAWGNKTNMLRACRDLIRFVNKK